MNIMKCNYCGKELNPTEQFCTRCGAPAPTCPKPVPPIYPMPVQRYQPPRPDRRIPTPVLYIAALAILILVFVLGILLGRESSSSPAAASDTAVSASSDAASTPSDTVSADNGTAPEQRQDRNDGSEPVREEQPEIAAPTPVPDEEPAESQPARQENPESQALSDIPDAHRELFQTAIDDFVSTPLNSFTLSIQQTHKPGAALWLKSGGYAYSSDTSVVTVSSGGKVTAVGPGSAYVIIISSLPGMYDICLYNVV